jgi:hypothetical protein
MVAGLKLCAHPGRSLPTYPGCERFRVEVPVGSRAFVVPRTQRFELARSYLTFLRLHEPPGHVSPHPTRMPERVSSAGHRQMGGGPRPGPRPSPSAPTPDTRHGPTAPAG